MRLNVCKAKLREHTRPVCRRPREKQWQWAGMRCPRMCWGSTLCVMRIATLVSWYHMHHVHILCKTLYLYNYPPIYRSYLSYPVLFYPIFPILSYPIFLTPSYPIASIYLSYRPIMSSSRRRDDTRNPCHSRRPSNQARSGSWKSSHRRPRCCHHRRLR